MTTLTTETTETTETNAPSVGNDRLLFGIGLAFYATPKTVLSAALVTLRASRSA